MSFFFAHLYKSSSNSKSMDWMSWGSRIHREAWINLLGEIQQCLSHVNLHHECTD